jgi:hypothetical protein
MGRRGRQEPLPGVASEKEVNKPSRLTKADLKRMGGELTKAKNAVEKSIDTALDLVASGSEAPATLEKVAQHLGACLEKIQTAQGVVRTGEV